MQPIGCTASRCPGPGPALSRPPTPPWSFLPPSSSSASSTPSPARSPGPRLPPVGWRNPLPDTGPSPGSPPCKASSFPALPSDRLWGCRPARPCWSWSTASPVPSGLGLLRSGTPPRPPLFPVLIDRGVLLCWRHTRPLNALTLVSPRPLRGRRSGFPVSHTEKLGLQRRSHCPGVEAGWA